VCRRRSRLVNLYRGWCDWRSYYIIILRLKTVKAVSRIMSSALYAFYHNNNIQSYSRIIVFLSYRSPTTIYREISTAVGPSSTFGRDIIMAVLYWYCLYSRKTSNIIAIFFAGQFERNTNRFLHSVAVWFSAIPLWINNIIIYYLRLRTQKLPHDIETNCICWHEIRNG